MSSIPPLENIEIPNTEVMRSTANFWFAAAGVHTEKAQTLETGAPFVSKNWSGRAGVSYTSANQKVLETGSIHQSHMLSVGELLSSTATQFDWGNSLQAMAQRQWAAATVLAGTGQVEAAALWYASARATQQTAVGVITQAYTVYTVGLKNLQAALPSKPLTPAGHAITFVPNGQPLSLVSGPGKQVEPPIGADLKVEDTHGLVTGDRKGRDGVNPSSPLRHIDAAEETKSRVVDDGLAPRRTGASLIRPCGRR